MKKFYTFLILVFSTLLSGCQLDILDPKGVIAAAEKNLLVDATLLMLIVVVPVIILSLAFTWRYRIKNEKAKYTPKWSHSNAVEAVCWAIPCVIIGILATMTWITTHKLDPYRPLNTNKKPIIIEAIALNWKWLFIYPKQNIATINYVQIPVNEPIRFLVTADAPMNSLEIPQLAGQIYAMTGMRTKLNLMATEQGTYRGLSTNFSGDGFSGMHFVVKVSSVQAFAQWVKQTQRSKDQLSMARYEQLAKPSEDNPAQYFSSPEKHLFSKVIMKYMGPTMKLSANR